MAVELFAYKSRNSLLHKIPAIIKLILTFVLCIFTFKDVSQEKIKLASSLVFCMILFFLGKCNLRTIRQLVFVLFLGAFVTLLRMFEFAPSVRFSMAGFSSGVLYTVRLFITSLACQIIFETTSGAQIQEAIESVENIAAKVIPPIKKLHGALLISLAINFMPLVFATWNKIHAASIARGPAKKDFVTGIRIAFEEFSALILCMLQKAETKRKAILNRGNYD